MSGSPAAILVTSRTPCPDSDRCSGWASASCPAVSTASRCGRCDVRATARSCSTGVSRTGSAPHSRASASTSWTASGDGVHVWRDRPRSPLEQRARSRPADRTARCRPSGGCRRSRPAGPRRRGRRSARTAGSSRCPRRSPLPRARGPPRPTRRCGRAGRRRRSAVRRPRPEQAVPAPRPLAVRTCSWLASVSHTSSPARLAARPTEVPSSPVPTTWIGPTRSVIGLTHQARPGRG